MTLPQKNIIIAILGLLLLSMLVVVSYREAVTMREESTPPAVVTADNKGCVDCHHIETPVIAQQWEDSTHGVKGVGCVDCHKADEGDVDAFKHEGYLIATIVTPKDCGRCHEDVSTEFQGSHHASAGKIMASLDNVLGEFAEGTYAAVNGCWQCHGSTVALEKDDNGQVKRRDNGAPIFDHKTWPNSGVGRLNLDGTRGSCSACHSRHGFKRRIARSPDNCGKCHMGPDHPQKEIYDESKHGIAFYANVEKMNLDSPTWVAGVDYNAAPTCATCHMSATKTQPITHDPGKRLSWNLRPPVSKHQEDWETKRKAMQEVCAACHIRSFYEGFYQQFDGAVNLYDRKFAKPGAKLMAMLYKANKLTPMAFDEELEWTWFRLWHHEGRRARHGASMQGPDYTQWHGFFEVAENFYNHFLPQVEEEAEGDEAIAKTIEEMLDNADHRWRKGHLREGMMDSIRAAYKKKYGQDVGGAK